MRADNSTLSTLHHAIEDARKRLQRRRQLDLLSQLGWPVLLVFWVIFLGWKIQLATTWFLAACALLTMVLLCCAGLHLWRKNPSITSQEAARRIDQSLALADRLSCALCLLEEARHTPMAEAAIADAQAHLDAVSAADVVSQPLALRRWVGLLGVSSLFLLLPWIQPRITSDRLDFGSRPSGPIRGALPENPTPKPDADCLSQLSKEAHALRHALHRLWFARQQRHITHTTFQARLAGWKARWAQGARAVATQPMALQIKYAQEHRCLTTELSQMAQAQPGKPSPSLALLRDLLYRRGALRERFAGGVGELDGTGRFSFRDGVATDPSGYDFYGKPRAPRRPPPPRKPPNPPTPPKPPTPLVPPTSGRGPGSRPDRNGIVRVRPRTPKPRGRGNTSDHRMHQEPVDGLADVRFKESHLSGHKGKGPSFRQVIRGAAARGFAQRPYRQVYRQYARIIEDVLWEKRVPSSHRALVRRYFMMIKPRSHANVTPFIHMR